MAETIIHLLLSAACVLLAISNLRHEKEIEDLYLYLLIQDQKLFEHRRVDHRR